MSLINVSCLLWQSQFFEAKKLSGLKIKKIIKNTGFKEKKGFYGFLRLVLTIQPSAIAPAMPAVPKIGTSGTTLKEVALI